MAGNNSVFSRAQQKYRSQSLRGNGSNSSVVSAGNGSNEPVRVRMNNGISARKASWIAVHKPRPKDVGLHDLVTIVVHEVSKHSTKADTKAEREYTLDAALKDFIRLNGGNLRPDRQSRGDPKISLSFAKEFEGKGNVKREDMLTARIQAEVIDVMPNGNLLLEAMHTVVTDEEKTTITLTGICRGKDVGIDNTILSSQLARLDLQKHHQGMARDATKRGMLSGLLDFLSPF